MKKIAVLMGGTSNEREISIASGENVAKALASLGKYDVTSIILDEESLSGLPAGTEAVYIALHGGWGENGGVQAALNALRIPYTGPGVLASQIAMDKIKTKLVLEMNNVPTAAWGLASRGDAAPPLPYPVVVKAPRDGSSVGISKVSSADEWPSALENTFSVMEENAPAALVEEFIHGREFTVPVLGGEAWPAVEIVTTTGWYGYEEKYVSNETRYEFLADKGEDGVKLDEKLRNLAIEAYKAVKCRGVTRVDFKVSPLGRCYVLELNTSPGLTSHSLVPKSGMRTGLTFAEVCDKILSLAATDQS
jgi:D-alanine-D-alanine ligase